MFDHRRRARLLKEALHALIVGGNVRPHDLDDAKFVEMDVADFENLAHAADAEAVENLVLAIEEFRRIRALKQRHPLAARGALFEVRINRLLVPEAGDLGPLYSTAASCRL